MNFIVGTFQLVAFIGVIRLVMLFSHCFSCLGTMDVGEGVQEPPTMLFFGCA